jgi:hypothetical protein
MVFIGLDDVIYLPGQQPAYVGGLRPDQFAFLEAYLATVPNDRLVVLALHVPLFDLDPQRETFRHADRQRLFALLARFEQRLVLSAHMHSQLPKVLRRGAWPGVSVYANVFMAMPDALVEYRIDDGPWQAMARVREADPEMLARNLADDASAVLRGYDRAPQAIISGHLWRAPLPTDLALGGHRIDVRTVDRWRGEVRAQTTYRLDEASP